MKLGRIALAVVAVFLIAGVTMLCIAAAIVNEQEWP